MSKQAQGGKARAEKLSPEERSAIAKQGAVARWSTASGLPKETHSGELPIGEGVMTCSVLENGMRVFSSRSFHAVMGSKAKGGSAAESEESGAARIPRFLASKSLKPFISNELMVPLSNPVEYRPRHGGRSAVGYEATLLPKICAAILDARAAKALTPSQQPMATAAEMMIRAFAQVGIIALIDEATGYQADRDKDELQKLLGIYLTEERMKWVNTFPSEFFTQIYRLRGWAKPLISNARTPFIGKIINKIVYEKLPNGVLEELRKRNPADYDTKRRKFCHHQFLSMDIGHPDLRAHIQQLLVLMRISDGWSDFERHFTRAFNPGAGSQQELGLMEDPV